MGNDWYFPIEQATARFNLSHEGYTGLEGSKEKNITSQVNEGAGTVSFATTRALGPRRGLTIVVGFPKGFVHDPTKGGA